MMLAAAAMRCRRSLVEVAKIGGIYGHAHHHLQQHIRPFSSHDVSSSSSERRMAGKVALITGAASGIGHETAAEFVRQGAKVIMADIQDELGSSAAASLGSSATYVHCNVADESHLAAAVDHAVALHGRLDVLFNNAGITGDVAPRPLWELDVADIDRILAVNIRAAVAGVKHASRVMVPRRSGCILCTASVGGIMGGVVPFGYAVSKAAVIGLVRSTAAELGKSGIRVNSISPNAIPTPLLLEALRAAIPGIDDDKLMGLFAGFGELEGATCDVGDIAKAAVYLASDEAKYVSGHNLVVDGGFTAMKKLNVFGSPQKSS